MRTLLYFLLAISFAVTSCRSSKSIATDTKQVITKKDSTHTLIDTTKKVTTTSSEVQTLFGDTLKATLGFTSEQVEQMENAAYEREQEIESNGIKIKVGFTKVQGGYKAKIKAIAKPTSITNKETKIITENNGVTEQSKVKIATKTDDIKKQVQIVGFPWNTVIIIIGFVILLIIGLLIYKYRNYLP